MAAAIGTRKSRDRINRFFDEADKDHNGYLTTHEFKKALKKQGYKLTQIEVKKQFTRFDLDGDNRISRDEFMACMGEIPENVHDSAMVRQMFYSFDKNGDGVIDRKEIEAVFREMRKKKIAQHEIDQLMCRVDLDHSGTIDYEEFVQFFATRAREKGGLI